MANYQTFKKVADEHSLGRIREVVEDEARKIVNESTFLDHQFVEQVRNTVRSISVPEGTMLDDAWKFFAKSCAELNEKNPAWSLLGGKLMLQWLKTQNPHSFSEFSALACSPKGLQKDHVEFVQKNADYLDAIEAAAKCDYDYAGVCTLLQSYLYRIKIEQRDEEGKTEERQIIESPCQMLLRVCCFLHSPDLKSIEELFQVLCEKRANFSSPVLFNSATRRPSLFACFKEGTKVITSRGAVAIEKVEKGDRVITHTGEWKEVSQTHKNPRGDREMVKLSVICTPSVEVTTNHEFLAIQKRGDGVPRWTPTEYLWPGDLIAIPPVNIGEKRQGSVSWDLCKFVPEGWVAKKTARGLELVSGNGKTCNALKRYVNFDSDFAFFLGCWYGDGNILTACEKSVGIRLVAHKTNASLIDKWSEIGEKVFGIKASICETASGMVQSDLCSGVIGSFFQQVFGKGFNGKRLPEELYQASGQEIYRLNQGLLVTDGCWTKNNRVILQMSNATFMKQLYYLLRSFGVEVSLGPKRIAKGGTKHYRVLSYPSDYIDPKDLVDYKFYPDDRLRKEFSRGLNKNNKRVREFEGQRFMLITEKTQIEEDLPEWVYTLGVEDDHSYCVEGIIAKNCYLSHITDDMQGITQSWAESALISMNKGGLGMDYSSLRHSEIGNGGVSRGTVPWIKIQDAIIGAVDQGSVRKGSCTNFMRDFHVDIEEFIELRRPGGAESMRARDLFYCVVLSDLFMRRVQEDGVWTLFCPNKCRGLTESYGEEFETLYIKYEKEGEFYRQLPARELYKKIYVTRVETGMPFLLFMDNVNRKSMQSNIGIIRQSNLCMEVMLHTSEKELASCVLASVCYPAHIVQDEKGKRRVDFEKLDHTTRVMVRALNQVTDRSYYPPEIPKIKYANLKNRPIGLGVQGFADAIAMLDLCWDDEETRKINFQLEEQQYFSAVSESCNLAKKNGPYEAFAGSPYSKGLLHTDLCDKEKKNVAPMHYSRIPHKEWVKLGHQATEGVTNSTLRARMPTATSAYMIGNNESFEPFSHMISTRKLLSGKFTFVNKHLYEDVVRRYPECWNTENVERMIKDDGSVRNFSIPQDPEFERHIRRKYMNAFEIDQSLVIELCADVLRFVDQGSSLNAHFDDPQFDRVFSWDFDAWEKGLKSSYYLRRFAPEKAIGFGFEGKKGEGEKGEKEAPEQKRKVVCNEDVCVSCQG